MCCGIGGDDSETRERDISTDRIKNRWEKISDNEVQMRAVGIVKQRHEHSPRRSPIRTSSAQDGTTSTRQRSDAPRRAVVAHTAAAPSPHTSRPSVEGPP